MRLLSIDRIFGPRRAGRDSNLAWDFRIALNFSSSHRCEVEGRFVVGSVVFAVVGIDRLGDLGFVVARGATRQGLRHAHGARRVSLKIRT
jgi:hypothetical protein